jgi:hypothetical protein
MAVFNKATSGFVGVKYTPNAVASQVVAGTNYCFLCDATVADKGCSKFVAKVYIFQSLENAAPHIYSIHPVTP